MGPVPFRTSCVAKTDSRKGCSMNEWLVYNDLALWYVLGGIFGNKRLLC